LTKIWARDNLEPAGAVKYIWQQYSKASCIVNRADLLLDFGVERLSFDAIKVAWMLQKCCNQKKTQWKYWTQWTFRPLKNAKIPTKTHEMDVLDALENRTLESHSMDVLDTMEILEIEQSKVL
jgi:hypothetical protein